MLPPFKPDKAPRNMYAPDPYLTLRQRTAVGPPPWGASN